MNHRRRATAAVKASGSRLHAVAINDYKVTIPVSDATPFQAIMARLIDDRPIPVREKGTLFVVHPFDSSAGLRRSIYHERAIWQLKTLDIQ